MSTLADARAELARLADPAKANVLQRFFKTGKSQYGEGDVFMGVTVPRSRQVATKYAGITLEDVKGLLYSKIHEERLVALLILVRKSKADLEGVARFYINNISQVNNWDLVDLSAPRILGAYLEGRDRSILYRLAASDKLWERRIAIIATQHFIRKDDFADTLKISEMLLADDHDLMHKAVGWMLREVGKRDLAVEEAFLQRHWKNMPRTALRYAIERFPEEKRRAYMARS
ncbi:MAG: DNA alkylation repair protein [Nitrososphaera sp.]